MGVCFVCASLKSMAKTGRTDDEIKNYKKLLKEHRESRALERSKVMHHRLKALQSPETYMCLIIDGMDQKKTCLPHFRRLLKDIGDECLVQMHLVGCLSYCQTIRPQVFITYPNIHNYPNLTVTVMQRVLQMWLLGTRPSCAVSDFNRTDLLLRPSVAEGTGSGPPKDIWSFHLRHYRLWISSLNQFSLK